jgi:hypothetical protein
MGRSNSFKPMGAESETGHFQEPIGNPVLFGPRGRVNSGVLALAGRGRRV